MGSECRCNSWGFSYWGMLKGFMGRIRSPLSSLKHLLLYATGPLLGDLGVKLVGRFLVF